MSDKADPHWVRDQLILDATDAVERSTGERNAREVHDYIVPILERMEQKPSAPLPAKSTLGEDAQVQLQAEAKRLGVEGDFRRFQPEKQPDRSPTWTKHAEGRARAERFAWMKSKPDYLAELKRIGLMMFKGDRIRALAELELLYAKSDKHLGRSWRNPEQKLVFS